MFRDVTLSIILFYVITVMIFVSGFYYISVIFDIHNMMVMLIALFFLSLLMAIVLAKISIEPLKDHFEKLEHFSKETLHELNLPISTINANTKMLRKNLTDEKSLKRIERIEGASLMLHERYHELDYLIKKQMQREKIEYFDLKTLIEVRLELLHSLYSHVNFTSDLESVSVNLDKIGLQKVIDNLIDNAVKYSKAPIQVDVRLKESVLHIKDNGRGMDELELIKIFDRYYQNDNASKGYGIGLSLVKNYCDRHNVKLHVKSKKGLGTEMILDFQGVRQ